MKTSGRNRVALLCSLLGSAVLLLLASPPVTGQDEPPAPAAEEAPAVEAAPVIEAAAAAVEAAPAAAAAVEAAPAVAEAPAAEAAAPAVEAAVEAVEAVEALPAAADAPAVEAAPVMEAVPATEEAPAAAEEPAEEKPAEESIVEAVDAQPEEIDENERVRRTELEMSAQQFAVEGAQAFRDGNFKAAVEGYKKAELQLQKAGKSERVLKQLQQVRTALAGVNADWAESLADEARRFADAAKYDEAAEKCREATAADPARKPEMDALIKKYLSQKKRAEFRSSTAEANVDIGKVEREQEISVLLEQGKVFYRNRRYSDARDCFEQVLVKDPYDIRAIRFLRQIDVELLDIAKEKYKTVVDERIAEVRWKWSDAVTPLLAGPAAGPGGEAVKKRESESSIEAKLKDIILDKIDFEEATIAQVVAFLKKRSQELDPDGEGVNIILQLKAGEGTATGGATTPAPEAAPAWGAAPAMDGGWGAPEMAPAAAPAAAEAAPAAGFTVATRTVTMSMTNIPLGEVVRYVCLAAGLKYKIESHAVLIADKNEPLDLMELRFYSVEAGVFDTIRTRTSSAGFDTGDDDDEDTTTEESDGRSQSERLRDYFTERGVEFPQGSKIAWNARTSKLIVYNTLENQRRIEKILIEENVMPTQVTIEAKFVEVQQTDLQALGFEWLITSGDGAFNDGMILGNGDNKLQILKQGGAAPFDTQLSEGLRNVGTALGDVSASKGILAMNGVLGNFEFQAVLHALSQSTSTNMLSAPKVTTLSGNTAILRMVQERYFPESWTEPEVTAASDTAGASFKPSIPEFGEARDVGVILEVTPTVAADGYSIDLDLKPRVEEFLRYDTDLNYEMIVNGEKVQGKAQMPIIEARTVETKVIVWDGETVVLGGLIREDVAQYKDKVPLLGDVPLLGRLFTNTGEKNVKRNLLIFVTARLVTPSGTPVRPNDVRGLPDFRR